MVRAQATMINSAARYNFRKILFFTNVSSRFRNLEAVARSPYRPQIARLVWILFYFLADAPYVHVHGARRNVMRVAQHCVEHLVAREYSSGMARQVFEQPKLSRRGLRQLPAHHQSHSAAVNLDIAGFYNRGSQRTLKSPQHGAHPRHQFAWAERFGDVVVGAEFQPHNTAVSYTHLRAHETVLDLVCRLLL